jgi:hypothetical protein
MMIWQLQTCADCCWLHWCLRGWPAYCSTRCCSCLPLHCWLVPACPSYSWLYSGTMLRAGLSCSPSSACYWARGVMPAFPGVGRVLASFPAVGACFTTRAKLGIALEQLRWYLEQWLLPTYAPDNGESSMFLGWSSRRAVRHNFSIA